MQSGIIPGQQQQQPMTVATCNQPQPAPRWVFATAPRPTTVPKYKYRQSIVQGSILITVGILSIVFNIVDLVVWSTDVYLTSLGFVGHGFWCGVMCIIAGGFGVGAGRRRNSSCQIRAFLVLSIIAACFCLGQFITAVIGAVVARIGGYNTRDCCTGSCRYHDYYYSYRTSSSTTTCNSVRTLIAMEALLAILSFIGAVAAICGSVLGCRAACCCNCCCCADQYPQQFAIIQNGVPMTIITQQQGGQMAPVQYPAQRPMQYPMNPAYPPAYSPDGGYEQLRHQFTAAAAPPYYPPQSTALASPPPLQPGAEVPPAAATSEPVHKNNYY